jgi:hypothetical protein
MLSNDMAEGYQMYKIPNENTMKQQQISQYSNWTTSWITKKLDLNFK